MRLKTWLVAALGLGSLALVVVAARRWSQRRPGETPALATGGSNAAIEAQLDEELRELD